MAFNTAVSGLRAASDDLNVRGNNIANASTTGFKASRTEFADVYASSVLGSGRNATGSGVLLANVAQQFTQGNIAFTDNALDLAINGNGFFMVSDRGQTVYTRSGLFSLDKDGNITNNTGSRLQGFPASASGAISGNLADLTIITKNLPPIPTTEINALLNVDASGTPPAVRGTTALSLGVNIGVAQAGGNNGYGAETVTFTDSDGNAQSVTTTANSTARQTAIDLTTASGVSATASTVATISNISDAAANMTILVNGVQVGAPGQGTGAGGALTANDLAIAINNLTNTTLQGVTAIENPAASGILQITSSNGENISTTLTGGTGNVDFTGSNGAAQNVTTGNTAVAGGTILLTLDEGVIITSNTSGGIFAAAPAQNPFINNAFDPTDQDTYNHATSLSIFDSLGNAHVLTTYFVKESALNSWTMYAQIDDQDVGNPNPSLPPPLDTKATRAAYNVVFNNDGSLNGTLSDDIIISYWNPKDANGNANGALGPDTSAPFPIPDPALSSNFFMDLSGTSQFGSPFSVNDISQNGFTTGRLAGVDFSSGGVIFARYTNGQSRVLGQLALANFNNVQGLSPQGNSVWAETFDSGNAIVGTPGSAALGIIQSGALEESNVELSDELVALIVAQRNFQANAKTIETESSITQSIINIR